jgi:peptidoglycan hydrolase FlgJ
MVLSNMLKPMFEGLSSEGLFGGGEGEEAFKSFYIDALAGQMVRSGGIGIADKVRSELLKMQEKQ